VTVPVLLVSSRRHLRADPSCPRRDVSGITQSDLSTGKQAGILVRRPPEMLETEIGHLWVAERDGTIVGGLRRATPFTARMTLANCPVFRRPNYAAQDAAHELLR